MARAVLNLVPRRMSSVFKSRVNPVSAEAEWVFEDEQYDFIQEIARSGYADMLHDKERYESCSFENVLYHAGIKNVLKDSKRSGMKDLHVVDIGTGTGLLSMMAARAGATKVTAIEAFAPVAETARKIIEQNNLSDVISVVNIRSTDADKDLMGDRADVCVAEVFDTELIGEGALRTFKDAHSTLLKKNARVIPASAKVFIQPIQSKKVLRWEKPQRIQLPRFNVDICPPSSCSECYGAASVHDVQLDELPTDSFIPLSPPVQIFSFDFENPDSLVYDEERSVSVKLAESGDLKRMDAILFWWELDMDGSGDLILSTEPNWRKKSPSQWRDHWMQVLQAIYYLPKPVELIPGGSVEILGSHDEYSFWFSAQTPPSSRDVSLCKRPICQCGMHTILSRTNLGRLNDPERHEKLALALESSEVAGKCVVSVSDCSLLPLVAAQMGAERVISVEKNPIARRILSQYLESNGLSDLVELVERVDQIPDNFQADIVIGDPFHFSSLLPWHNLHFLYSGREVAERLGRKLTTIPECGTLWGIPVQLKDLWKIRAPVGTVEGFDLTAFDRIVQNSITKVDSTVEPHPLWEYPSVACGEPVSMFSWEFNQSLFPNSSERNVKFSMSRGGTNAIALWMDWGLGEGVSVSTGLTKPCLAGEKPEWDWYSRQGVYFLPNQFRLKENLLSLDCNLRFDARNGDITFCFS